MIRIPFNRPFATGDEIAYMQAAIAGPKFSGDGRFTAECHALLEQSLGVAKALLTTSCTHALEMAALLLGIGPGDEVIVPAFTFVSTVNAFVLRGARPVFVDIRPDTLNIDEKQLEVRLTNNTKAIFLVHYAGIGCEMDAILRLAQRHRLAVVEDNAHGLFGKYRGRFLGTIGDMAALSFHETKNFTCGEGGALLLRSLAVWSGPRSFARRERIAVDFSAGKSTNTIGSMWVSSYPPSDLLAAFLRAQLEHRGQIQSARRKVWETYLRELSDWALENQVRLPVVPPECEQSYHMFYLIMPSLASRQALIFHLGRRGILAVFHYLPLHLSIMGRQFGGREGDCPVTEVVSDRLLRLPFFNDLTEEDQAEVISAVCAFRC